MHYKVEHVTRYCYDAPVFLEPHTFRLRPASDPRQTLLAYSLTIEPEPAGRSDFLDLDGATATSAWFGRSTDYLLIRATSEVTTHLSNPFDYLWACTRELPFRYEATLAERLVPYLGAVDEAVRAFGDEVMAAAEGDAQRFPTLLASAIHSRWEYESRPTGAPLTPAETLYRGRGSCRDLAVLYLAVARGCGFAGRFVSGYHAQHGTETHQLHAWAELYLPDGGWRGFDPSTGFAAADSYIALAAGPFAADAAPVSGSFRGRAPSPEPEVTLRIEQLGSERSKR